MSVLRYISALLLILIITLQSGFITVWALTNSDVVIHRLEELEIQAELLKGQEEYEQEISRLLVAKEEYETSNSEKIEPTFIVDPFTNSIVAVEPISPSEQIQEIINTPLLEGEEAKEIKVNREIQEKRTVKGTRGTIAINMNMGTIISSYKGDTIDPSNINISSVTPTIKSKAHLYNTQKTKKNKNGGNTKKGDADEIVNSEVFEFGIPGQHLVFSSPVAITIEAPLYSDGTPVDIAVLHAGDAEFNTSGLSTSTDTLCNSDGSTSNPGSQAIVKNGRITFYTCGASTFALGYVPARDIPNNTVWTLSPTADNKVIIGGQFTTVGGVTMGRVARVSTGGFLDTTFTNPNVNNTVYATAIQSDGKILIGGTFTTVGGIGRTYLARLNTDGSLDGTFNVAIVGSQVRAIKIQTDGKILIGGTFTTVGGVGRNRIARLNTDGSLDGTFNPNANNTVYTIAIQTDGKILVGGTFTTMGGIARTRIARVSTLGVLDVTFNPILTATAIWDIQVQTDGQIVFGGQFTIVGGVGRNNIARVSTLGVLDVTFNPNVTGGTPVVYTILIENNGNIIFGGTFTTVGGATTRNRIARYSSTGVLDTTLNPNANSTVYALGVRTDGVIAIGGLFTTIFGATNNYIAYMNPVGTPDSTYRLTLNNTVWTLSPTADNKVIIGGQFTTVGGVTMGRVARVSTGGFLDTTFTNPNVNNTVYATAIQSDGKILIGGTFTTVGGIGRTYLARLNTDGSLDGTFNVAIVGSQVRAIKIQTDGKILIGGTFTTVGGVGRNRIARLNTDGSLDGTFNPNANNTVYTIAIQTDGKILVGGTFTTMGGVARTRIARVSTLGVLDVTFNPILTATAIWNIQVQTDGQIVFGGQFTIVGGVGRNNIARVSTLGVLDVTFNPNVTGGTPVVYTILIENNGNIIFGGTFTTVEGATTRNRIARYSSTGVLDTTLNPNANSTVYALGKDQSYNLLVGGAFTTMSTKTTPYFSWVGLNTDFISPNMDSISLASGTLLPIGNLVVTTTYSDTGVGIDISSVAITLEKWNGTSWGSNIAATYLVGVPIITTGTGIHSLSGIPYGKYRFRTYVSDLAGNTNFIERTFYVDAIEWDISSDIYDIGILPTNTEVFGTGTMTITVKTVGAGFTIKMTSINTLVKGTNTINYWNGVTGWGYDSGGGTLGNPAFGITVGTESNNINLNGLKNTYTYTLKYGAKVNSEVVAGLYNGSVKMDIIATY